MKTIPGEDGTIFSDKRRGGTFQELEQSYWDKYDSMIVEQNYQNISNIWTTNSSICTKVIQ